MRAAILPDVLRRHSGATITLLDQGFVSGVNFLTIVLLARELTLTSFGVFMIALSVRLRRLAHEPSPFSYA